MEVYGIFHYERIEKAVKTDLMVGSIEKKRMEFSRSITVFCKLILETSIVQGFLFSILWRCDMW